jgi:large subunit ribosomal protein L23
MSKFNATKRRFNEGRLMQLITTPLISEKATMVGEANNTVVFKVLQDANKYEIKAAVEMLFKVDVEKVSVLNKKGKQKRFGRHMGRHRNIRKAYVTVKAGQDLNFSGEGL